MDLGPKACAVRDLRECWATDRGWSAMDFYKLIKSLDALVFEVLSWLYFYPRTLIRTLLRPVALMADTRKLMDEDDEPAWGDRIGPPLFLALTLVVIHFIEEAMGIEAAAEFENPEIKELMSDDTNLVAMRVILFGVLPLLAAVRELKVRGIEANRIDIEAPFYAQCYAAAGYAVLVNCAFLLAQYLSATNEVASAFTLLGGVAVSAVWIGLVEARWFHRSLGLTRGQAFRQASLVLLQWLAIGVAISFVLV